MARRPSRIAVVQCGAGFVSLVRADASGAVLERVSESGPWALADGTLAPAFAEFSRRHRLAEDRVFLVLPRHEAAVRILDFPSQDAGELSGMVQLGAEEIVPFPLEELHTSHCLLERTEGGSSRVLAVVLRKAALEEWMTLARAAKLEFEQILLSTPCILTALRLSDPRASRAVVHLAPDGLEVLVARDGRMLFGRGVALAAAESEGRIAREALAEIAAELRNSLSAARRESADGAAPAELLVSADGLDAASLAAALSAELGLPAKPFAHPHSLSLVAAGALAAARGDDTFNVRLLPESEHDRRATKASRSLGVRLAACLAFAALALGAAFALAFYQRSEYLRELEARAEPLRPAAQTLRVKRQQLNLIHEQISRAVSPIEILSTVATLAPDAGLNLTRFAYDHSQGVTLNGGAVDPKSFDALIDALRNTGAAAIPQLARAQEAYRQTREERGQAVWDFAITVPFEASPPNE